MAGDCSLTFSAAQINFVGECRRWWLFDFAEGSVKVLNANCVLLFPLPPTPR
jgi:hypothetical protein